MKKILILALGAIAIFSSCKKKKDTPATCEVSVAGIAGNYKLTKIETVAAGIATDVTNSLLDPCEKDDVYQFNSNKSFTYQDAGTACSPSSVGTGSWDVTGGKLVLAHSGNGPDITSGSVTNNCTSMIVDDSFGGATLRYTFTKQ
jgi:Lipocalin-like domain